MTKTVDLWSGDKSVRAGVFFGLVFWLLAVGLVSLNFMALPPEIPWFYSLPWGDGQLIPKNWLLIIVISFGAILVLNTILARVLGKEEELLRRILIWGAVASELLMLLSLVRVIMVIL